ncbi:tRNA (adenosine(37)-N6)-threonylcarbamoyltransferase complex dimerization subunit type 1 TsaB [Halioxenophilus sp. WMMB6]|uniref:tRNA (adenosine(37)-N6)-threonylcarbamoyltransferase complex dimerization subunit type 1 TsaB n=1 Tax=Halioxenophilus sp. WMMB6 TaxID=3073815 RepID=UPI00295F281E|nr:tRNA (adenosine(37)-N6)-threonylcarbamoyltransferase complex dimerization subunit type 1 TsaB [Halioxenophilus sp. WMMB6]
MTKILCLESSSEACSVALCSGEEQLYKIHTQARQHAQVFLPLVDELLAEAGVPLSQLDAIGFGCGPGSFTGVRICLSITQGLAMGADLPVLPISTLQALACAAEASGVAGNNDRVMAALDARMNEVYFAVYQLTGQMPKLLDAEAVLPVTEAASWLPEQQGVAVGSGWQYEALVGRLTGSHFPELTVSALDILRLARLSWQQGAALPVESVTPVYLRDEVTWKKREPIRQSTLK